MSIRKDGKGRNRESICECDECGTEEYQGTLEFRDWISELRDQGWQMRKDAETDKWEHRCPDCA